MKRIIFLLFVSIFSIVLFRNSLTHVLSKDKNYDLISKYNAENIQGGYWGWTPYDNSKVCYQVEIKCDSEEYGYRDWIYECQTETHPYACSESYWGPFITYEQAISHGLGEWVCETVYPGQYFTNYCTNALDGC